MTTLRLSHAQLQSLHDSEAALIKQLPLPIKDWQKLIQDLCWAQTKGLIQQTWRPPIRRR